MCTILWWPLKLQIYARDIWVSSVTILGRLSAYIIVNNHACARIEKIKESGLYSAKPCGSTAIVIAAARLHLEQQRNTIWYLAYFDILILRYLIFDILADMQSYSKVGLLIINSWLAALPLGQIQPIYLQAGEPLTSFLTIWDTLSYSPTNSGQLRRRHLFFRELSIGLGKLTLESVAAPCRRPVWTVTSYR